MFKNSSISSRVTACTGLFVVLAIALGAAGIYGINAGSKNLDLLYQNRAAPIQRLQEIKQLILQNRIAVQDPVSLTSLEMIGTGASVAFRLDPNVVAYSTQEVEKNLVEIARLRDAFVASDLNESEKTLTEAFKEDHAGYVRDGIQPALTALRNGSPDEAKRIILTRVRPLYDLVRQDIDRLIEQESAQAQTGYVAGADQMRHLIVLISAVLAAGLFLVIMAARDLSRAVVQPLGRLKSLLHEMAEGFFEGETNGAHYEVEFASIFDSIKLLRQRIQGGSPGGTGNAHTAQLALLALDRVSSYVMISDQDQKIVYVNKSLIDWFTPHEAEIRKDIPPFYLNRLVGSNADIFHKAPDRVRKMLATATEPMNSSVSIGGRHFKIKVFPLFNESKERLGSCVQWSDITERVEFENIIEVGFASVVRGAAKGDFTQRVMDMEKYGPVMEKLGTTVNELIATTGAWLDVFAGSLRALAAGDLTNELSDEGENVGVFTTMLRDNNETVKQMSRTLRTIRHTADTIKSAATEIAAGNVDLSQRTEQQAASLEETASSMEELASTVKQNAENARQANQLAEAASAVAIKGGDVVGEVVSTMNSIQESSRKVVDIISVIDGIAFQTNILALNAAVEAARAGEQGRGFAVVASEVRNLAQRSAAAAKEIKQLISDSFEKVESGNRQVEDAGRTMKEIVTSVRRVTDIMSEISAASAEQSAGIDQVNLAITQMDEVTQQNAALVEQAAAAAESLEEQSRELTDRLTVFKLTQVADEVSTVRTAAPVRTARPVAKPMVSATTAPVAKPQRVAARPPAKPVKPVSSASSPAASGNDDDWHEF